MTDHAMLELSLAATVMFVILVFFIICFILIHYQKKNKMRMERQRAIFNEQERTMSQLSREVHDNIAGFLNLAMMNLHLLTSGDLDGDQKEAGANAINILTQVLTDVHNISHSMNGNYIKSRGLFDVLNSQLKYISSSKSIQCRMEETGETDILTPEEQLLIYRIAQEGIQNTIKHSGATELDIVLNYSPALFIMSIKDNGEGFNKEEVLVDGIGLMNMRERAHMLHANLEIDSAPGKGCTITLALKPKKSDVHSGKKQHLG